MKADKRAAFTFIAAGFAFSVAAFLLNAILATTNPTLARSLGQAIVFGNLIVVVGCIKLARAKGRPWAWGLLGILNVLGAAILWYGVSDRVIGQGRVS
jgi:hypothetical protein